MNIENKIAAIDSYLSDVYPECDYPILNHQAKHWKLEAPLQGINILDTTPIVRNCLLKYRTLLLAGANLSLGLNPHLGHDKKIIELMKTCEVETYTSDNISNNQFDIIADCAGCFAMYTPKIGYVELTKTGVYRYSKAHKPVFLADSGKIKKIETCLGTGDGYFRAMSQLGYSDWNNKILVLFGSGKVGTGIMYNAKKRNIYVKVITDLSSVNHIVHKYADEIIDMNDCKSVVKAVESANAIVTASGVKNAVCSVCPKDVILKSKAIMANMGIEDEYGSEIPKDMILNQKHSLNFILQDPTQVKYIDATLGLHNEGMVYIATHHDLGYGFINPPTEIEENMLKIIRQYGTINNELNAMEL